MSKNLLNSVKLVRPPSSWHDLSHDIKLTCNMGQLIPVYNEEVVPGDRFKISCELMARLVPMVSPMMHLVNIYVHYFFVPYRLLWPNFEKYITNTKVAGVVPACPYFSLNNGMTKLSDYLGLPFGSMGVNVIDINAWFHSAYNFIWNEFYRDQNLSQPVDYELQDGDNVLVGGWDLLRRAWEHDYFTACLPFAQKGDAVDIPLGVGASDVGVYRNTATSAPAVIDLVSGAPDPLNIAQTLANDPDNLISDDHLYAKTTGLEIGSTTIKDLRRAHKLQEFLEREAVGGTRYTEQIYAMTGVRSSDKRLQRPEYITGSKSAMQISEVLQTSETAGSPQGTMAGHGIGVSDGYGGSYFAEEHGCIMGIMSIMPKTGYFQGIPRKFNKVGDRYDYYWNLLEHIGEQEVLNKEVHAGSATPNAVFGYNPRYTEYKVAHNRVAGEFREALLHWHMARDLNINVALNEEFISCNPTMRVFAVEDPEVDHVYVHLRHRINARRLMSKYSTPGIM